MIRRLPLFYLSTVLLLLITGDAAANKFVTISGGVASNSADKIALLKVIAFYAGIFFSIAGVGLLIGKKQLKVGLAPGIVALLLGLGLISVKYF
ncbi:MAG: hypothetical protein RPU91_10280 [Candidatus Sedimenticola sp. (ex Thyasira tokunagai)]